MSPLDTQRLAAIAPSHPIGPGTRAATGHSGARQDVAKHSAPAPEGVRVEVGAAIEPGQPPVDSDRVAEIRSALKDGSYPIVPTQIADALIAARLMLGHGE
ncbi:flagellar biosynthesis anti-sigma factor FlgM [Parerythrobacter jejuensis]|uniref:Flagellar biosynthesis anti-sigma factor FlgM n=1 Tax=Parerythrobacter jejuensis TaxID=795812 RepID=A0A845AUS9_9SPHN|nr:flagellar biosynthesis anti-sigma factor FlgM [Parerythrobacter jejuensis]MXP30588.1 flagellar biosynthesis anti-sigma factor FlgM [Parerythrobacter jejuensis]MXP33348.1 flagellar biosynthesis anti-sigma factor FlgM [Parerythrobacter jejuensis]